MSLRGRGKRKVRMGIVTAAKMTKTVTVTLSRLVPHPLYGKILRRKKKILVHDEEGTCQVGDRVQIMEMRPLSRRKRWRVLEVLSHDKRLRSLEGQEPAAELEGTG